MSDESPNPKSERDSRKETFFREARAILFAQGQWNDETRMKLRLLADRLRLPADVYEVALQSLVNSETTETIGRWEQAYLEYLEKQFEKFPGDILTLKAERKAIAYGQKRFQLTVDTCDRLIETVAEKMNLVRISETEALRHARSEVVRLATGKSQFDEALLEQVVTAVADWGVDPNRARQLLDMQLIANRRRQRQRWINNWLFRTTGLLLGVATVIALLFLGRMIVNWESGESVDPVVTTAESGQPDPVENQVKLPWWSTEDLPWLDTLSSAENTAGVGSKLGSSQAEQRREAYLQVIQQAWSADVHHLAGLPAAEVRLSSRGLQQFLMRASLAEGERENRLAIMATLKKLQWTGGDEVLTSPSGSQAIVDLFAGRAIDRLLIQMAETAHDQSVTPEQMAAFQLVDADLASIAAGQRLGVSVQRQWDQRRWSAVAQTLRRFWFEDQPMESLSGALDQKLLRDPEREAVASQVQLPVYAALAGLFPQDTGLLQQCFQLADEAGWYVPLLELMMLNADPKQAAKISEHLRQVVQVEENVPTELSSLEEAVWWARRMKVPLSASPLQRQLRIRYLLEVGRPLVNTQVQDPRLSLARVGHFNSLSLALLESGWDFEAFDRILLEPGGWNPEPARRMESRPVAETRLSAIADAKDGLQLEEALVELRRELDSGGRLTLPQSTRMVELLTLTMKLPESQVAMQKAFRSALQFLMLEDTFLLAMSDAMRDPELEAVFQQISQWTELQMTLPVWSPTTLKSEALSRSLMSHRDGLSAGIGELLTGQLNDRMFVFGVKDQDVDPSQLVWGYSQLWRRLQVDSTRQNLPELDERFSNLLLLQYLVGESLARHYGLKDLWESQIAEQSQAAPWELASVVQNENVLMQLLVRALEDQLQTDEVTE